MKNMIKNLSGPLSLGIALVLFLFVQAKTVDDVPCLDESSVPGSVWFLYTGSAPATPSSILNPDNYRKATSDVFTPCDGTETLCAICTVPQKKHPAKPDLSLQHIKEALNGYNFSAKQTADPSGAILEH